MEYWSQAAAGANAEIQAMQEKLGDLNIEDGARQKILNLIQQANDAEQTHVRTVNEISEGTNKFSQA